MSEMVERVAKAIRAVISDDWEYLGQVSKDMYLREARAAIEAMRKPTASMCDAGYEPDRSKTMRHGESVLDLRRESAAIFFNAMIDEALR